MQPSPRSGKKYRVVLKDGTVVDFGGKGYEDYTTHKDPLRMREYVRRHGGVIPKRVMAMKDPVLVHKEMLKVNRSTKENWSPSGSHTPGFWSRWLLWSHPDTKNAKRLVRSLGVGFKE